MDSKNKDEKEHLPLRERNRQRVRERIIAAAKELFRSKGYSQTTIDDIAEKAEVSRATLFNYFPTKDSLLFAFVLEVFQSRIRPGIAEYLRAQPTTIEAMRVFFMNIHEFLLTIPDIERAFKQEFMRPKDLKEMHRRRSDDNGFLQSLAEILKYGQARGEIRTDMPVERQAQYIGILYLSIFYSMVFETEFADYATEVEAVLAFIQSGLQPKHNE